MTSEQFDLIIQKLSNVIDNQIIIDKKLDRLINISQTAANKSSAAVDNQFVLGKETDQMMSDLKTIKRTTSSILDKL